MSQIIRGTAELGLQLCPATQATPRSLNHRRARNQYRAVLVARRQTCRLSAHRHAKLCRPLCCGRADGCETRPASDSMPTGMDHSGFVEPEFVHYPGPDGQSVPAWLFVPEPGSQPEAPGDHVDSGRRQSIRTTMAGTCNGIMPSTTACTKVFVAARIRSDRP